ncbi:MAG: serine--tRNA ligase [Myxococcota bacterium]
MLNRKLIHEQPDLIRSNLNKRHASEGMQHDLNLLLAAIDRRRELLLETEELRAQRNQLSRQVGPLMKAGKHEEAAPIRTQVKAIGDRISLLSSELNHIEEKEHSLLLSMPNLLDERVPDGKDEDSNVLIAEWGTLPEFDFEPKEHHILGSERGLYDAERAAKIAGTRFSVLKGGFARLERAIISFFLDEALAAGYEELVVPYIVNRSTMTGTGQLPKFEEDLFKLTSEVGGEDAFLIPTAEVPVTNLHADEILKESMLPLCYAAFTPCFRAEAGSYGKDTHGLIRQHQFHKVELVKITTPEQADEAHESLTAHARSLLEKLGLSYRVVRLCGGDIGFSASHCYDLEVWLPGQGKYREISSCSNFGEFQARRMKLRYRPEDTGKPKICHTINGSGLAVGRTLVAIVENYQTTDGKVKIPAVLQPYMGGQSEI